MKENLIYMNEHFRESTKSNRNDAGYFSGEHPKALPEAVHPVVSTEKHFSGLSIRVDNVEKCFSGLSTR